MHHLENHIQHAELKSDSTLHVIGVVSNPSRYHSRYRIAREWVKHMEATKNVKLYIVEAAFGDRHHEITSSDCERHLQLNIGSPIWIKENMINLGVANLLPRDWKYMAWVDMDVFFRDPNWALETIHQLQHYHVVQPWRDCIDLSHRGDILETHKSFGSLIAQGVRRQKKPGEPYHFGHPGFAWACTRYFWNNLPGKGLMDFPILGSGDHHMACAMVNESHTSVHNQMHPGFIQMMKDWEKKAFAVTKGVIGFVSGLIEHKFHGPKNRRFYRERWQILVDHGFNPGLDLTYDHQGVLQLNGKPALLNAIHRYNLSRCEDSIEDK